MILSNESTPAAYRNGWNFFGSRSRLCGAMMLVMAAAWLSAASALAAPKTSASPNARNAEDVPEGLSSSDWSSIRAAYEANRHAAFAVEGGYQARNPSQQWRTRFDGRGFETTPDAGGWSWGLELISYGRGDQRRVDDSLQRNREATGSPSRCMEANGGRVSYEWDDTLTEWYVNDSRGLEHGYTVRQRPAGSAGFLQFTLAVRGDLRPRLSGDGRPSAATRWWSGRMARTATPRA